MRDLARFLSALCFVALLVLIQGTRFLSLSGTNPNLILIFFSGLLLAPSFRKRIKFNFLLALLVFTLLVGSFVSGFWLLAWMILMLLVLALYFIRDFLTGHPFPDFLLVLGFGTPIFYGLLKFMGGGIFAGGFIIPETAYNLVLGAIFWFCLHMFGKYDRV